MSDILIPEQAFIRISYPSLSGSREYKEQVDLYQRIHEMLIDDGLENHLKELMVELEKEERGGYFDPKDQLRFQKNIGRCLRINIARKLINCSFKKLSIYISDSNLLQWFCDFDGPDTKKIPCGSTIHNLSKMIPAEILKKLLDYMMFKFGREKSTLSNKIDLKSLYMDSTCVKLNMHHPVDWVLLKDAIKSIMFTIKTIRKSGIKHRINPPDYFISQANKISMSMTMSQCHWKSESKKRRKDLFRQLKSLLKTVEGHGENYLMALQDKLHKSNLSKAKSELLSERLLGILDQVDDIIHQAHERVIGERKINNKDKILSLYERHAKVYKRGKAGAEVEFGLQLFISETKQGLIPYWDLRNEVPQHDSKFVKPCLKRLEENDIKPKLISGDRGFSAKGLNTYLKKNKIQNHICPKNPKKLRRKLKSLNFVKTANRRAQTEARIGILKNNFIGRILKSKGFKNQEIEVGWSVIVHNLWVLARMESKDCDRKLAA